MASGFHGRGFSQGSDPGIKTGLDVRVNIATTNPRDLAELFEVRAGFLCCGPRIAGRSHDFIDGMRAGFSVSPCGGPSRIGEHVCSFETRVALRGS
jgi:hypothetical protein